MSKTKTGFFVEREQLVSIIERLKNNDPNAEDEAYNMFRDTVYGYIVKDTGNKDVADDLIGLVLTQAFMKAKEVKTPEAFVTYAKKIAKSRINDYYRIMRRSAAAEEKYKSLNVSTNNGAKEEEYVLEEWISGLSPKQARAIRLKMIDNMSVKEIAALEDIPIGTVKSRLFNARRKIKEMLESKGLVR